VRVAGRGDSFLVRCNLFLVLVLISSAHASESDSVAITVNIQANICRWYGGFGSGLTHPRPGNQIVGYTRCGDSALWTGAYWPPGFRDTSRGRRRVAERKNALAGLTSLWPGLRQSAGALHCESRFALCGRQSPAKGEQQPSTRPRPDLGGQSLAPMRLVGAFFGIVSAYDLVDDASVKSDHSPRHLMLGFIAPHHGRPTTISITRFFAPPPGVKNVAAGSTPRPIPSHSIDGAAVPLPIRTAVLLNVQATLLFQLPSGLLTSTT